MSEVGNWRNHILVKCRTCKKLMGYHKVSDNAQCITCELNGGKKDDK